MTSFDGFSADALVRAAFCSGANFSSWADPRGVEVEISRIMYPSPRLDADQLCGGIFHVGNRYFLQCIEGPRQAVEELWQRTQNDVRHRNPELLIVEAIGERLFPKNTMSYVSMRGQLIDLLKRKGVEEFNPYRIDAEMLAEFLEMWRQKQAKKRGAATTG